MRFGGLAAVSEVDLAIEPNTIFSVIGPNGAGKTTLFNCITGLSMPTGGAVRIAGRNPARQWGLTATAACLAAGLACGLALALAALDLNGLWRAAIRRPANFLSTPFSYRESWRQTAAYLRGDLAIERQREGRWQIVTADGRTPLGIAANQADAQAIRDELDALSRRVRQARVVRQRDRWIIAPGADPHAAGRAAPSRAISFASRGAAEERLGLLAEIDRRRSNRWMVLAASFAAGGAFGYAGTWAVWRRSRWTPDLVARAGVARTFQNLRLFQHMTARENVLVALDQVDRSPGFPRWARWRSGRLVRQKRAAEADELLRRVGLVEHGDRRAWQLSYGDQRRLEIARALATRPRLLLLDEPAAGMNPVERAAFIQLVRAVRAQGVTVVLIEHHVELVMGLSDRIAVLDGGRKIAEGTADEVRRDPAVLAAYLGC